jgi:hypothetical protein
MLNTAEISDFTIPVSHHAAASAHNEGLLPFLKALGLPWFITGPAPSPGLALLFLFN